MKKLITTLLIGLLITMSALPVFADTNIPVPPSEEQMAIQNQAQGQAYADKMNEKNKSLRTPSEIWTFDGIQNVWVPYTHLKAKHAITVAAGTSQSQTQNFSISVGVGEVIKNWTIEAAFSQTKEVTYSGPAQTDTVGSSGKKATHNIYNLVTWGSIKEYRYRVTNEIGQFLRYEYINQISDAVTVPYCQKVNIAMPTYYESGTSSSYRTISDINAFYLKINSPNGSNEVIF